MGYKSMSVQMTPEHFDRSIKGSPKEAIKELIWNACDADAKNIEVKFEYGGIQGAEEITGILVYDDGHGIPYENVSDYFGKYGRSQKTVSDKSPGGRIYHGKLGQGRYKCLSAATFVDWETIFATTDGKQYKYEIKINSNSPMDIDFNEVAEPVKADSCGTIVHLHGIQEDKVNAVSKLANNETMIPELLTTFAPYLLAYSDISLIYNGVKLNPTHYIEHQEEQNYSFTEEGKPAQKARALFIRWKQSIYGKEYICGNSGVVYDEKDYGRLKDGKLSLYLLSDRFETMHKENTLLLGNADPAYSYFEDEARKHVKEILKQQENDDAVAEIGRLKLEGSYPYLEEPIDDVGRAEQSVFDVLAVEVNRVVPQLKSAPTQAKKLTYRLMREAINTNPSSIKTILTEVFNLTTEQQNELAELLTHTHLPEIIDVAKTVSDRLTFIRVLEEMVYNDSVGKAIKERTQFHRLLLKELWVFGEKYALGTSDQSLKNLLKAHIRKMGREELIPEIPPEAVEDLTRIPDICLFEQYCRGYESYEHLVIELKRPTLTLTLKELDQIRDYAFTVAKNDLFDKATTKWHFILLGQSLDDDVTEALKNEIVGEGNYYNAGNISISVHKWSKIIQENKLKYEFLKSKLNHQLSEDPTFATDYLFAQHAELFPEKQEETK